ncbi:phosphoribosylanthranilate isomerase [soil metagenome]
MSLIVKICGLSTEETLDAALAAGAEMVGFNFFPKSPRYVTPARAAELAKRIAGRAEIVTLSVDMEERELNELVRIVRPDWVQLHGTESTDAVEAIRAVTGRQVMKALPISAANDIERAHRYAKVADRLLLDAKPPKDATRPGGNGMPFDWALLDGFDPDVPYLLSGGLAPGNVADAVRITGAPGVDVSSGVETAPGRKDPDLIRAFIANARGAVAPSLRQKVAS